MRKSNRIIYSLKNNQGMNPRIVLTEFVDNAVDANATRIRIIWEQKRLVVEDNGVGVSPEGFEGIYTLGGGTRHVKKTSIGRYGIGAKEAAGWLWGQFRVTSRHEGVLRRLAIDWEEEANAPEEDGPGDIPVVTLSRRPKVSDSSFTKVECSNVIRDRPSPDQWANIAAHLSHIYRPALANGLMIEMVRGRETTTVTYTSPPARDETQPMVSGTFTVDSPQGARIVTVHAYVTVEEQRHHDGIHIAVLGRAMGRLTTQFQSRYLYGWVTLGSVWEVAKNKTEITDPLREKLMAALEHYCRSVLDAAERQAETVVLSELELTAENLLNDGIQGAMRQLSTQPGLDFGLGSMPSSERPPEVLDLVETVTIVEGPLAPPPAPPIPPNPRRDEIRAARETERPAPRIAIRVHPLDPDRLTQVTKGSHSYLVEVNSEHRYTKDFVQQRGPGGYIDPMRLVSTAISALSARAVIDDELRAAMPWLKDTADEDRYSLAAAKLWDGYLIHRVPGQELE
jgi:hypothetical protein